MKVTFDISDKESAEAWKHAKRTINVLKKKFTPDIRKKLVKDPDGTWNEQIDDIDEKLAPKVLDLEAQLLCMAFVCDIKEEK